MIQLKRIPFRTILFHALFWVAVWFFFFYFFSYNSDQLDYALWFSSGLLPLTIGVTYFVNYRLIPRYLMAKQYWKFALYSFYTFVYISYIISLLIYTCLILVLKFNLNEMPPMSKNFFFVLLLVIIVVGVISFVSILNQSFKTATANKELQNKILETQLQLKDQELHYLKRQIHPHFLFNTLNTIYGFALKQSKQTPDIILKLSNLLDYILYQVNKPLVSLKEEVLHIQEYIELEKVRFQDTLKVEFKASEVNEEIQVAPMLLIPFVENAFKHGNLVNGFLSIKIEVRVENNCLEFEIGNSFIDEDNQHKNGGLGLLNIRKRLDLNYPNNYELTQEINKKWYTTKLVICDLAKTEHSNLKDD
ncbi:histidine kinase [Draconibacterium sp. IB214405]|uniref:sensor histidine kinase n=1 Tax=Draconibacterium sp. IB214405 TaxID=3097352 RepID=UPI002A16B8A0|nr:histidine kinase [Draconibacterium sp. IB214405]MDX8338876.1 histidine kinase [Draconibacterium sp. IB214405]